MKDKMKIIIDAVNALEADFLDAASGSLFLQKATGDYAWGCSDDGDDEYWRVVCTRAELEQCIAEMSLHNVTQEEFELYRDAPKGVLEPESVTQKIARDINSSPYTPEPESTLKKVLTDSVNPELYLAAKPRVRPVSQFLQSGEDFEHTKTLNFIRDRMEHEYKESPNVDYVRKLDNAIAFMAKAEEEVIEKRKSELQAAKERQVKDFVVKLNASGFSCGYEQIGAMQSLGMLAEIVLPLEK